MATIYGEIALLIKQVNSKNSIGDTIAVKTERQVFVDRKDIKLTEFYQAQQTGLRPEIMFVMRTVDYEYEQLIKFENQEFRIIRTYRKDKEFVELICQGLVGEVI